MMEKFDLCIDSVSGCRTVLEGKTSLVALSLLHDMLSDDDVVSLTIRRTASSVDVNEEN